MSVVKEKRKNALRMIYCRKQKQIPTAFLCTIKKIALRNADSMELKYGCEKAKKK